MTAEGKDMRNNRWSALHHEMSLKMQNDMPSPKVEKQRPWHWCSCKEKKGTSAILLPSHSTALKPLCSLPHIAQAAQAEV